MELSLNMSKLTVITVPHQTLREVAQPVTEFNDELKTFADNMLETMYAEKGIGLAANQVNELRRVIVVDVSEERNEPIVFINPEIIEATDESLECEEGCLSLPSMYSGPIPRAAKIKVRAQDVTGEFFELVAGDLLARCIQHEIDHLDGILFIDYLSRLKQERVLKKLARHLRDLEKEKEAVNA